MSDKQDQVIQVPTNFTPRFYQALVLQHLESGIKRILLKWARRFGKDKISFICMVWWAYRFPGNYYYTLPLRSQAKSVIWEGVEKEGGFRLLDHIPPEILYKKPNATELSLTLRDQNDPTKVGSIIRCVGMDKLVEYKRGISCHGLVVSEMANAQDEEAYKVFVPAVRETNGWIIFNSTPQGRGTFYQLEQENKNNPDWYVDVRQCYYPDLPTYVPLLTKEELDIEQKTLRLTDEDMAREYGCSEAAGLQGSYYINELNQAKEDGRIGHYVCDPNYPVDTYWDLAGSDYTVCWFGQDIGNTSIFFDYYEEERQGTDDLACMLQERGYHYGTHFLPHDAVHSKQGRQIISTGEELRISLENYNVSGYVDILDKPATKQPGIMELRSKLKKWCFDEDKCQIGLRHLELYHKKWDRLKHCFSDQPVHDLHSHSADALRIAAESKMLKVDAFYKINKLTVLTNSGTY